MSKLSSDAIINIVFGIVMFITWLLLTQPLTVASAVSDRDLMPVMQAMARTVAHVLAALLRYL